LGSCTSGLLIYAGAFFEPILGQDRGVSLNPAEYASRDDIDVGSHVPADFVGHFSVSKE
jgi:hypothetical protein